MTKEYAIQILVETRFTDARYWVLNTETTIAQGQFSYDSGGALSALENALSPWIKGPKNTLLYVTEQNPHNLVSVPSKATSNLSRKTRINAQTDMVVFSGFCQDAPKGILTQGVLKIIGYLAEYPEFDGVLCLAEDHSQWVRISAGEIVSFASFSTGEMFQALTGKEFSKTFGDPFLSGVQDGYDAPGKFSARINSVRAEQHLSGTSVSETNARIGGILVGIEIASARPYWLGMPVVAIGNAAQAYQSALTAQGASCETFETNAALFHGISALDD